MNDYIHFELNNRKVKINRNDNEDISIYREYISKRSIKSPYWRKIGIWIESNNYCRCRIGNKRYMLHRVVYYAHNQNWSIDIKPKENPIDHIDHNTQNNDISNLRWGTVSLNAQNQKKVKGYYWNEKKQTYRATITVNGIHYSLGSYKKEEDAIEARRKGKEIHHEW